MACHGRKVGSGNSPAYSMAISAAAPAELLEQAAMRSPGQQRPILPAARRHRGTLTRLMMCRFSGRQDLLGTPGRRRWSGLRR